MAANEGLPVTWETPDGFLIQQCYHDHSSRRIDTVLDGKVMKLSLREELPTIDKIYGYVKARSDAKMAPGRPAVKREG